MRQGAHGAEQPGGAAPVVAAVLGLVALVGTGVAVSVVPSGSPQAFVVASPAPRPTSPSAAAPVTQAEPLPGGSATPVSNPLDAGAPVTPRAAPDWVAATSSGTGVPARAVQAYGDATLALADEDPGCRLGWTTLAGIGWIESGHGRAGLRDDGLPATPIVGPALDGSPGRAAIPADAESTQWHGDPAWDHAVGPMQFIPSTWRRWATDGDGDGAADPQDIDDAALAAARYLCAGSRDLSTGDGWWAAVLSYNHSDEYAAAVLATADRYAAAVGS